MSCYAALGFGIVIKKTDMPWSDGECESAYYETEKLENWWRVQHGYVNVDKNDLKTSEEWREFFDLRRAFDESHSALGLQILSTGYDDDGENESALLVLSDSLKRADGSEGTTAIDISFFNTQFDLSILEKFRQDQNPPTWHLVAYE